MIYPDNFEQKIGFDLIRIYLKKYCVHPVAFEYVDAIKMTFQFENLQKLMLQIKEFRQIMLMDTAFPTQNSFDLRPEYHRISIEGRFIEPEQLSFLRSNLMILRDCLTYLNKNAGTQYPYLHDLGKNITIDFSIFQDINDIIDEKGQIKSTASVELQHIRREIIRISRDADRKIQSILKTAKYEGIAKDDAEMTLRNGRLCIPIPAGLKRKMKGFIHDESATGQTVFIEPTEVFDANNMLKDLTNAERQEIIRILTAFTDKWRPSIPDLLQAEQYLGNIDFIKAKTRFAFEIKAIIPIIRQDSYILWYQAFHPLLYIHFKQLHKEIVPMDVELNDNHKIMIISGPNAGGKSIALKSIALIQYMFQCGLAVPVAENSEFGIFKNFFIDMGDEQSIDNDLSTYSSHLFNMKIMLENTDVESLFLIDEFGSGTEPNLGAAMAETILEHLYQRNAFGVITTHFGNLKKFADIHSKVFNAAMLFDTQLMQPLFRLRVGNPGSSFTYEIAERIGFSHEILEEAKQKGGTQQIDYEVKLQELEVEALNLKTDRRMLNATDEHLATLIQTYTEKVEDLEVQKKEIIKQAKLEAKDIIANANKMIEHTVRMIKEHQADKLSTQKVRQEIIDYKQSIDKDLKTCELSLSSSQKQHQTISSKFNQQDKTPVKIGDYVLIMDTQTIGEVLELKNQEITIGFNAVHFKTTLSKVEKISKNKAKEMIKRTGKYDGSTFGDVLNTKITRFNPVLDIRGKRVEEVLSELNQYIDDAVLLGIKSLKIIHGKGYGVLRQVVRQELGKRSEISKFEDESVEYGGAGVTLVSLF